MLMPSAASFRYAALLTGTKGIALAQFAEPVDESH